MFCAFDQNVESICSACLQHSLNTWLVYLGSIKLKNIFSLVFHALISVHNLLLVFSCVNDADCNNHGTCLNGTCHCATSWDLNTDCSGKILEIILKLFIAAAP